MSERESSIMCVVVQRPNRRCGDDLVLYQVINSAFGHAQVFCTHLKAHKILADLFIAQGVLLNID